MAHYFYVSQKVDSGYVTELDVGTERPCALSTATARDHIDSDPTHHEQIYHIILLNDTM